MSGSQNHDIKSSITGRMVPGPAAEAESIRLAWAILRAASEEA